ncbi:hypothetical protein [Pseudomonas sp. Irchel 3E13]|jgi:hypothetical protein|uniref:hypothetical protein n=1 Tax=Pseudomonas sp. Irchel 3E13 TaxID=2008975 RepID=UPI00117B26B4|nr:hypothetical protein [Pseudomonas sp. Irchel 3E13]
MLKILYIYLRAAKIICLAVAVSGCWFLGSEPHFTLRIENDLDVPVAYCYRSKLSLCSDMISSREYSVRYYDHVYGGAGVALKTIREQAFVLCGVLVRIDELEDISPIEHVRGDYYRIVLNELVGDRYCH